jgi:esterase/lipase
MRLWKPLIKALTLLGLVLFPLYLFGVIPILDSRYQPSSSPAYQPADGESFGDYIEQNRARIRESLADHFYSKQSWPFGQQYPIDKVVQMRAPYELPPDSENCRDGVEVGNRGFLLIHGLTDSPYLLSELANSLKRKYPCSYVRSLLVPGHGTVPGDLLSVELDDWRRVVGYGVQSFESLVDELYLVGYSSGSSLALDYLQENPDDSSVSGFIFLSPGFAAAQKSIALAPWLKYLVRWVSRGADADAAKYDSMPTHAAALFHRLTVKVSDPEEPVLELPVFMVMSGDDTTVDTDYAAEFFCSRVSSSQRRLVWYRSLATGATPPVSCSGLEIVDVAAPQARFVSHSHVAITMPPENEHYGLDGNYTVCSTYLDDPESFSSCSEDDSNTLYGESTLRDDNLLYQGKLIRRATFNPYYQDMVSAMACFIDTDCAD